jgi:hypothetical protein
MANDTKAFISDVTLKMVGVLMLAYVGATILSILDMSSEEVNHLLPTNLALPPYNYAPGTSNSEKYSVHHDESKHSNLHNVGDDISFAERTRDLLEYFYPMETVSFPYTSWFMHPNFKGTKGHMLAQWFALSCANAFCWWRSIYKGLILIGRWMLSFKYKTAMDWFIFYIFPYFLYWLILLPIIPFFGFGLAALGSGMKNIPGSYMLTMSPFFGGLFAVGTLIGGGIFNVYSWILSFMIFGAGFAISLVSFFWWVMIGVALWLYTIFFLFFAPILSNSGTDKVWKEFRGHNVSMAFIFIILVLISANTNLDPNIFKGVAIASGVILLYNLYVYWNKPVAE